MHTIPEPTDHESADIRREKLQDRSRNTKEEVRQEECFLPSEIFHERRRQESPTSRSNQWDGHYEIKISRLIIVSLSVSWYWLSDIAYGERYRHTLITSNEEWQGKQGSNEGIVIAI